MKLYTFFRSSASYRVRIGLNLKGLKYDSVPIHIRRGEQHQAAYAAVNPQQLVPALVDGPFRLPQSLAILEYLDEKLPTPEFLPASVEDRALVRAMALGIACDIHPLNNLRVLGYLKDTMQQDEKAIKQWYQCWVAEGLSALESMATFTSTERRYLFGDVVSLADICLVPQLYGARRFDCSLERYPTLLAVENHLSAQQAFAAAAPQLQPDAV